MNGGTGNAQDVSAMPDKNRGLQALRGIAVLMVFTQHLIVHANELAAGPVDLLYSLALGGLGVFTFFALSAYLMIQKANDPARKFLLDRVRRIYPAFWLAVAVTLPLQYWAIGGFHLTWQLMLLLPFGDPPTIAMPYWTLFYELLFYGLVVALASIARWIVVPAVLLWAVVAFVFYERPYGGPVLYALPSLKDFLLPMMAVYFGFGTLARLGFAPRFDQCGRVAMVLYAVGALLGFCGFRFVWHIYVFFGLPSDSLSDAVFLTMGVGAFCAVRAAALWRARGFVGRALATLGDQSYGIYLIHAVLLLLAAKLLGALWSWDSFWLAALALAVGVLPLSMLFGMLDVGLQRWLKRLQPRLLSGPPRRDGAVAGGASGSP